MGAGKPVIRLKGGPELVRAFGELDRETRKELRVAMKVIAEDIAGRARPKVPILTGLARRSVRSRSSTKGATILGGTGKAQPYYARLEFGGLGAPGRYLYPTIAEHSTEIGQRTDEAIAAAARSTDFETRGHA